MGYTSGLRSLYAWRNRFFKNNKYIHLFIAEAFGTFVIVLAGVGVVNTSVFTGAQTGLWQVAVVWGFGVTLAIITTATVSGAHLNPAVSLAFSLLRPESFSYKLLPLYWTAQVFGAIIASAINFSIFGPLIAKFEADNQLERGEDLSEQAAMAFGEYFPNPGFTEVFGEDEVSVMKSFYIEFLGTAMLMLVILAVTDPRNGVSPMLAPFWIGFTVAVMISLYAPLNQAGYNPARDFGPRLVSLLLGWDDIAIPGPRNGFWTYIVGPLIGAPFGGFFYDLLLRPVLGDEDGRLAQDIGDDVIKEFEAEAEMLKESEKSEAKEHNQ
eukprot:maker-scaffold_15-snap-gene-0.39-mRNA-1 protein AED:0.01 eAED:0.01 QI:141/1/1/1/1/1/2/251/323